MAGHSKWANIKHRKERADAKKGKVFSRIAKEIISAAKLGGPDLKSNARLKAAVQKARDVNFPNDSIERNIKKGCSADQAAFHEITYELYGHGGVGLIVEVMTDNKNRIASEMRIACTKRGGTIAEPGSVAYLFERKGVIEVARQGIDEESLFLATCESGAEDLSDEGDLFLILTPPEGLHAVKESIDALPAKVELAQLRMIPKALIECDEETGSANLALIDWLEALDDVDAVYHNMTLPDSSSPGE